VKNYFSHSKHNRLPHFNPYKNSFISSIVRTKGIIFIINHTYSYIRVLVKPCLCIEIA